MFRRTALLGSRLAATALACSALMAIACPSEAAKVAEADAENTVRNAHAKPAPIPLRVVIEQHAARLDEEPRLAAPTEAAKFESEGLLLDRLRHACTEASDTGPVLGRARRTHRLTRSALRSYLLFGSGRFQSGIPALV